MCAAHVASDALLSEEIWADTALSSSCKEILGTPGLERTGLPAGASWFRFIIEEGQREQGPNPDKPRKFILQISKVEKQLQLN